MIRIKYILLAPALGLSAPGWASVPNPPDERLRGLLMEAVAQSDSFSDRYEAEVWLMDMVQRVEYHASKRLPGAQERGDLLNHIHYEAKRANLPPELVLAVIDVESRFNSWAISNVGAQGLMQIMPFWLKEIGRPRDNLFDVRTNLRMGCTILSYYLKMEQGNLPRALARYNGSTGSWKYPNLVLGALRDRWYKR
jgi:soluble lytic murein transglycosylase-like protein